MGSRFNSPPNWPAPPSPDWVPPSGWEPDPSWGPAPYGWSLWVEDPQLWSSAVGGELCYSPGVGTEELVPATQGRRRCRPVCWGPVGHRHRRHLVVSAKGNEFLTLPAAGGAAAAAEFGVELPGKGRVRRTETNPDVSGLSAILGQARWGPKVNTTGLKGTVRKAVTVREESPLCSRP